MAITIKVDAEKALGGLRSIERNIRPDLEAELDKMASATKLKMSDEAPKGTWTLSKDIRITKGSMMREIEPIALNLSGKKYAAAVEKGSGPAAGNRKYLPNVFNIERYYGVDKSIAWAIAKSIQQRGNVPNPFVKRTYEYIKGSFKFVKDLARRIAIRYTVG